MEKNKAQDNVCKSLWNHTSLLQLWKSILCSIAQAFKFMKQWTIVQCIQWCHCIQFLLPGSLLSHKLLSPVSS
jgi:hypothetical protein